MQRHPYFPPLECVLLLYIILWDYMSDHNNKKKNYIAAMINLIELFVFKVNCFCVVLPLKYSTRNAGGAKENSID